MTAKKKKSGSRVHVRAELRLERIHREISSGKCPTTRDLAEMLERCERTVKRDLAYLREQKNAPLHFDPVRRGWRYLEPGWSFEWIISEGEFLAFFTAEQALKTMGRRPEAELLRAGLAKLAARLPEMVAVNLGTLGEALSFQQLPHTAVKPSILKLLARAAAEKLTIWFEYYSQHRNEVNEREADVLLMHNFGGDWYAIAFDHLRNRISDFHAGRIKRLRITQKQFDPPANWDPQSYLRRGFFMTRGGRTTTAQIVFDEYQARWMREREKFHPDERREELAGGELRLSFPVGMNGLEAVARFCLAYAGHCRVEQPAALRNLIRERLSKALSDHKKD